MSYATISLAALLEMFTCVSGVTITLIEYRGLNSSHSRITGTPSSWNSCRSLTTVFSEEINNVSGLYDYVYTASMLCIITIISNWKIVVNRNVYYNIIIIYIPRSGSLFTMMIAVDNDSENSKSSQIITVPFRLSLTGPISNLDSTSKMFLSDVLEKSNTISWAASVRMPSFPFGYKCLHRKPAMKNRIEPMTNAVTDVDIAIFKSPLSPWTLIKPSV